MNPICFYHSKDLDGVASGAIVKHFVPDCELVGIDYGDEFPWDLVTCSECGGNGGVIVGEDTSKCEAVFDRCPRCNSYVGDDCADPYALRKVYMVDFSLPFADMKRLNEITQLTLVDHHKSAIEEFRVLPIRGMQDSTRAACELTWVWFASGLARRPVSDSYTYEECNVELPEVIRLLGAYDTWRKDDPGWASKIMPFQYGMRSVPEIYDPLCPVWSDIRLEYGLRTEHLGLIDLEEVYGESGIEVLIDRGRTVLSYQTMQNAKDCKAGSYELRIHTWPPKGGYFAIPRSTREEEDEKCKAGNPQSAWYRAIACNTTVANSQFFDGFYDPDKHDIMVSYNQRADGRWRVSVYTEKGDVDCGAIAKSFGGGGHKKAAGFVCKELPWLAH